MKRKLLRHSLFVVGLLVVFVAVWPIVVGGQMESRFMLAQTFDVADGRLEYRPQSYARHWYSARAQGVVHFEREGLTLTWPVQHEIRHRVLGVEVETSSQEMDRPSASDPGLQRWIRQGSPRLRSFVGINNGLTVRLNTQEVSDLAWPASEADPTSQGIWDVGAIRGGLALQTEHWILSLESDFVSSRRDDEEVHVRYPHFRLAMKKPTALNGTAWLPDYDFTAGVDVIHVPSRADGRLLRLEGLGISASQSMGVEKLDAVLRFNAGRLVFGEQVLAPIESYLRLIRLDYRRLAEWFVAMGWVAADERFSSGAPQRDPARILAEFLETGPEIQLGLSVNTDPARLLRFDFSMDVLTSAVHSASASASAFEQLRMEAALALGAYWWQTDWEPELDRKSVV